MRNALESLIIGSLVGVLIIAAIFGISGSWRPPSNAIRSLDFQNANGEFARHVQWESAGPVGSTFEFVEPDSVIVVDRDSYDFPENSIEEMIVRQYGSGHHEMAFSALSRMQANESQSRALSLVVDRITTTHPHRDLLGHNLHPIPGVDVFEPPQTYPKPPMAPVGFREGEADAPTDEQERKADTETPEQKEEKARRKRELVDRCRLHLARAFDIANALPNIESKCNVLSLIAEGQSRMKDRVGSNKSFDAAFATIPKVQKRSWYVSLPVPLWAIAVLLSCAVVFLVSRSAVQRLLAQQSSKHV